MKASIAHKVVKQSEIMRSMTIKGNFNLTIEEESPIQKLTKVAEHQFCKLNEAVLEELKDTRGSAIIDIG